MKYYDEDEKEFIDWYVRESDSFVSVGEEEVNRLQEIFEADLEHHNAPYTKVSFNVNSDDLVLFKQRAEKIGIPYKRLLALLVHKYASTSKNEGISN